jgi:hypothetical protein
MQMNSKHAAASGMRCCYPLGGTMTRSSTSRVGEQNDMIFATRFFRSSLLEAAKRHKNLAAGFLLLVFTLVAVWGLVNGGIVVGKDTVTQHCPWYSYLGERLRSGDISAWNPYQFSGAPLAADPLSGWTYLPAMADKILSSEILGVLTV